MRFFVFFLVTYTAMVQGAPLPDKGILSDFTSLKPRDGIAPSKVGRFWERWHPVTTRYRADISELRFTYANDAAWKALVEGRNEFPDGAEFAKIGTALSHDTAFPGSATPDRIVRVQLMRKEKTRYRATDGWGYALYTDGLVHEGEPTTSASCHACHTVVRDRDFVFSQPAFRSGSASTARFADSFHAATVAKLTTAQKMVLARSGLKLTDPTAIRLSETNMFVGTISETLPAVAKLVQQDGVPHLVLNPKSGLFVAAALAAPGADCKQPVLLSFSGSTAPNAPNSAHPAGADDPAARFGVHGTVEHRRWCDGKTTVPR